MKAAGTYPSDWPQGLIDVAEIIGADAALALSDAFGGVPVYVPKAPDNGSKLAAHIGLLPLRRLSLVYGGDWLTVPRYAIAKSKKRTVERLLKEGASFRDAALQARVTVRFVTMVAGDMRGRAEQLKLF